MIQDKTDHYIGIALVKTVAAIEKASAGKSLPAARSGC